MGQPHSAMTGPESCMPTVSAELEDTATLRDDDKRSANIEPLDDTKNEVTVLGRDVEDSPGQEAPTKPYIPDGGLRAWLLIVGTHCATFSTFGFINAWGVFQEYYEQTLLQDKSPSTIAWIGSIQYSLVFMTGLPVGRLFDRGYFRLPVAIASACLITATFLVAECTEYYQFILCQGFAIGLSSGLVMGPCMNVVSQWFTTNKSLAFALTSSGASTGGVVFPIAARKLIPLVGFPWTMRILGFMQIALLTITNSLIKRNLPHKENLAPMSLRAFRNPVFAFYCAGGFITFLGLYTVLTYISVSARAVGVADDFAFYLVAIANAASTAGRAIAGLTADRIGPLTTIVPATVVAAVTTYAWPSARSEGAFIAVAVIYGATSGVFVGLFGSPPVDMGELSDYGTRFGLFISCTAFGALAGPPISGAINQTTGGFKYVGIFAGTAVLLSVAFFVMSRHMKLGRLWGKA